MISARREMASTAVTSATAVRAFSADVTDDFTLCLVFSLLRRLALMTVRCRASFGARYGGSYHLQDSFSLADLCASVFCNRYGFGIPYRWVCALCQQQTDEPFVPSLCRPHERSASIDIDGVEVDARLFQQQLNLSHILFPKHCLLHLNP